MTSDMRRDKKFKKCMSLRCNTTLQRSFEKFGFFVLLSFSHFVLFSFFILLSLSPLVFWSFGPLLLWFLGPFVILLFFPFVCGLMCLIGGLVGLIGG